MWCIHLLKVMWLLAARDVCVPHSRSRHALCILYLRNQVAWQVAGSSKSRKKNALDGIGGGGSMRASGGGGSYEDHAGGSSRSRLDFRKGSG